MRPVKSKPRFRCDFCKHVSTKDAMIRHERRCWKNPNRYCETCENTGKMFIDEGMGHSGYVDCWACSQFDPMKLDPFGELKKAAQA